MREQLTLDASEPGVGGTFLEGGERGSRLLELGFDNIYGRGVIRGQAEWPGQRLSVTGFELDAPRRAEILEQRQGSGRRRRSRG